MTNHVQIDADQDIYLGPSVQLAMYSTKAGTYSWNVQYSCAGVNIVPNSYTFILTPSDPSPQVLSHQASTWNLGNGTLVTVNHADVYGNTITLANLNWYTITAQVRNSDFRQNLIEISSYVCTEMN